MMKRSPRRSGNGLRRKLRRANQYKKPSTKTKPGRFDTIVGRYYRSIYSFASRMTDDPLEAVLLTHNAFNRIRKETRSRHSDGIIVMTLIAGVLEGLNARGLN